MPDTMVQTFPSSTMPPEISKAIGEVMSKIKSLPKNERNDHGGYNFASVDDFLAAIGPLLAQTGLIVIQDEYEVDTLDRAGKAWLKATYSFVLAHVSGAVWDRPMKRTVFQQITGPQTTGSCQSYSLKQFLRSLFAVPCGDHDDADYHKPNEMAASAASAAPARQEVQDRPKAPKRPSPPKPPQATQQVPGEPEYMAIPTGRDGALYGRWTKAALDLLADKPERFRREWLELHAIELAEMRTFHPEYCDKVEAAAIVPDLPHEQPAE